MHKPQLLLARLDAIGRALAQTDRALALIGLGSSGAETQRMDDYSDLDFFVIVEAGAKPAFLTSLGWLAAVRPIVYQFQNTPDGYKLLFDDDIFCEFAIFEPAELARAAFTPGRVIWRQPQIDDQIGQPTLAPPAQRPPDADWLANEALTNLYVGLGRYHRGEKLSAARFIQQYAVDRIVELSGQIEAAQAADVDPFTPERRYERRFPATARALPAFIQGYERSRESAAAILDFLEQHVAVNPQLARRIRALIE